MYACLAVTCHLHFWQNDRDFLRATVVTRGWNGYRNKSQHRKSTLEKKILPPFQQGFEPATFQSRVRCSNHWAIPAPLDNQPPQSCMYLNCFTAHVSDADMSGAVQIPFPPSSTFQRSNDADYLYYGIIRHLLLKRPRVAVLRSDYAWHAFPHGKALSREQKRLAIRTTPHWFGQSPPKDHTKCATGLQVPVKSLAGISNMWKYCWQTILNTSIFLFYFLSDINHSNTCKHCANYFTEHFTFVLTKCHTNTGVTVTDVCRRQKPDKWRHCQQAGRTICQISISAGLEYSNSKQMV